MLSYTKIEIFFAGSLIIFRCSQIDAVQPCVVLGGFKEKKKKGKKVCSTFLLISIPLESRDYQSLCFQVIVDIPSLSNSLCVMVFIKLNWLCLFVIHEFYNFYWGLWIAFSRIEITEVFVHTRIEATTVKIHIFALDLMGKPFPSLFSFKVHFFN